MGNGSAEQSLAEPQRAYAKRSRTRKLAAKALVELPDGPLGTALARGIRVRLRRDQPIFREGDAASFVDFIVEGGVRLSRILANGRRQITTFRLPGDLLGIAASDTHSLLAEALCETVVIRLARARFEEQCRASAALNRDVMNSLRREISETQTHLVALGRQTARERVATFLLRLAARNETGTDAALALPMGRGDMADYLGLTLETVCRTISEMKHQKLILMPSLRSIVIRNLDTLAAVADSDIPERDYV